MKILRTYNSAIDTQSIARLYTMTIEDREYQGHLIEDPISTDVAAVVAELNTGTRIEVAWVHPDAEGVEEAEAVKNAEAAAETLMDRLTDLILEPGSTVISVQELLEEIKNGQTSEKKAGSFAL